MIVKILSIPLVPVFFLGLIPWAVLYAVLYALGLFLALLAEFISCAWTRTLLPPPGPPVAPGPPDFEPDHRDLDPAYWTRSR